VPDPERGVILGYFEQRFGIPLRVFHGYHLLERRKAYVLLRHVSALEDLASLQVQGVGLPVLRKMPRHLKPTSVALQCFGMHASRHRVELSADDARVLLYGQDLAVNLDLTPGYVVLVYDGHVLGCGLYTPGRLRSQVPRRQDTQWRLETV
jgi:NOL1/NOP2/fmu family ribosome biogenesis protein